jgi:hypothetical protein
VDSLASFHYVLKYLFFILFQLQQINFLSLMQIVGPSFANLPDVHQLLQQAQSVHFGGSQVSNYTRESGDVEVNSSQNLKEKSFIKPQSMEECTRELCKTIPQGHEGIIQSEDCNGNLQVMYKKNIIKILVSL